MNEIAKQFLKSNTIMWIILLSIVFIILIKIIIVLYFIEYQAIYHFNLQYILMSFWMFCTSYHNQLH